MGSRSSSGTLSRPSSGRVESDDGRDDEPVAAPVATRRAGLAAELQLDTLKCTMQKVNSAVAALWIASVRERVRLKPAHATLEGDDVDVIDEVIRGTAAVAPKASDLAALESFQERPEVRGQTIDARLRNRSRYHR